MTQLFPDSGAVAARQPRSHHAAHSRGGVRARARSFGERLYLRVFRNIGLREYDALGLGRTTIPWEEKKRFAGKGWYMRMIERVNPAELRTAAWHKVLSGGVLAAFDIPSPQFYGTASPHNGLARDGLPLRTAADLESLVERFDLRRACFKLVAGWSGRGLMRVAFERRGSRVHAVRVDGEDEALTLERFWTDRIASGRAPNSRRRQMEFGYLCQEEIRQHPDLGALHPESLNTLRVWMAQLEPGEWTLFGAVLRMGTGQANVDNGAGGGIGAPVDVATGQLGRAVRRGRAGVAFAEFDQHPTTGARIRGVHVPHWDAVRSLCQCACAAFPYLRFMGLDVAVAPDGPVLVEVEADPHTSHQAHLGRGIRPLMIQLAKTADRGPLGRA